MRPTSGSSSGDVNIKTKVDRLRSNSDRFIEFSDSESSDSDEEGDSEDEDVEPPSKKAKLDAVEVENRSNTN